MQYSRNPYVLRSSTAMGVLDFMVKLGIISVDTSHSYLRIPGFLSREDTDALLTRARQLLQNFSLEDHPLVRDYPAILSFHSHFLLVAK